MDKKQKKNNFLKEFFKARKTVGSVWPSSSSLRKKILKNIDFNSTEVIVEFGPGMGVFTREIAERMSPTTQFFVFELHQPFYESLTKEFKDHKNIFIINDSAEKVGEYLAKNNVESADVVVSSLPLSNFGHELATNILKAARDVLKVGGRFVQYQYTLNNKKDIEKVFSLDAIQFTPINIPPAFVYVCNRSEN